MDKEAYEKWWPLHLRVARGEELTEEEQAVYQAGIAELDREESFPGSVEAMRQTQAALRVVEEEYEQLLAEKERLDRKLASIELARNRTTLEPEYASG